MLKLRELETRTQEIVFLLFLALVSFFVLAGGLYLYLAPKTIISIIGTSGTVVLKVLFHELGYAYFLLPLCLYFLGEYINEHTRDLEEILRHTGRIFLQIFFYLSVILIIASFFAVFEGYFSLTAHKNLEAGLGGLAGRSLGGILFQHVGLLGSVLILSSLGISIGVFSKKFDFVDTLIFIGEYTSWLVKSIWKKLVRSLKYLIDKLGLSQRSFMRNTIEFEASSGTYHTIPNPPYLDNYMSRESVDLDIPIEEKTSLKFETEYKPENVKINNNYKELVKEEGLSLKASEEREIQTNSSSKEIVLTEYRRKRYHAPSLSLLEKHGKVEKFSRKKIEEQCKQLEEQLNSFKLNGKIIDAHVGACLTLYEFQPDVGVKLSKIASLDSDLALVLGAPSIRILTPIPGKKTVGIEVPHTKPSIIGFHELLKSAKGKTKLALPVILGKTVYDESIIAGIEEFPHLLISGSTGSGKSVFMNTLINSLIFNKSPRELRFLMIDPKMIELTPYNDIPHLIKAVITSTAEAKDALKWAEKEMDERYQLFKEFSSRNIESFNTKIQSKNKKSKYLNKEVHELPYIVIVIDEIADLIITQGKEVEIPITRIAQKARAAGIHLVIATQRPSADIISGLIKTNFPTRISFKVSSNVDSRTILDTGGAEKLLGNGDMLYLTSANPIQRIQGSFITEDEVRKIVQSIKKNN